MSYTAAVITVSDKGYAGQREDTSGPNLCRILKERNFDVSYTAMIPDDREMIKSELKKCADELGISQSYISRLEKRIIARLKKEIIKMM